MRALIQEQHTDLAHLPLNDIGEGWDNRLSSTRSFFVASARGESDPMDDHTLIRARGWVLALGLAYLARSLDDAAMGRLGLATIDAVLHDE